MLTSKTTRTLPSRRSQSRLALSTGPLRSSAASLTHRPETVDQPLPGTSASQRYRPGARGRRGFRASPPRRPEPGPSRGAVPSATTRPAASRRRP